MPSRQQSRINRSSLLLTVLMLLQFQFSGVSVAQTLEEGGADPASAEIHAIIDERDPSLRIIGGNQAREGDWPSIAAIATVGIAPFEDRFMCGGTLVDERHVLTAAHCLYDFFGRPLDASDLRVSVGLYDLSESTDVQEQSVSNIFIHPEYNNTQETPPYDIALLELANIVDAPINALFAGESEFRHGETGYIIGWGATRYENERALDYPSLLQQAAVPLVSLSVCNSPSSYNGRLMLEQLCAGYPAGQVDTCAGDSGGPLYLIENGLPVQVGITSFGLGCAEAGFYGVYTDVSYFIPWLSNYIRVPEQSADLLAQRQAGIAPLYSSTGRKRSGGALHPILAALLLGILATRLAACSAQTLKGDHSVNAPETSGIMLKLQIRDKRLGVDALQLGMSRENVMQALDTGIWRPVECDTSKSALLRRGRLYLVEQCQLVSSKPVFLADHRVQRLSVVMVDDTLSRVELLLLQPASGGAEVSDQSGVASAQSVSSPNSLSTAVARWLEPFIDKPRTEPTVWRTGSDEARQLAPNLLVLFDTRIPQTSLVDSSALPGHECSDNP